MKFEEMDQPVGVDHEHPALGGGGEEVGARAGADRGEVATTASVVGSARVSGAGPRRGGVVGGDAEQDLQDHARLGAAGIAQGRSGDGVDCTTATKLPTSPQPRQILRLAGLDLCASKSGKSSERAVPRISKQGKSMLRFALVQAARVATRASEPIRAYFTKLLEGRQQERGIRLKRTVKLAAKLLVIAWTLMRKGETFDPGRLPA